MLLTSCLAYQQGQVYLSAAHLCAVHVKRWRGRLPKGFDGSMIQATPPVWVVTSTSTNRAMTTGYFNPHHPHGWWLKPSDNLFQPTFISIHTTHVGGDQTYELIVIYKTVFQSTPPMWMVTTTSYWTPAGRWLFQSTPPGWVVTCPVRIPPNRLTYFNPHHPPGWWLQSLPKNR